MSWAIVAVTVASAAYSAHTQRQGAKQQQYNLERQAEQESLAAENEEIMRRERLNKVLAANVASASAAGMQGESLKSISLESARRASSSEGAESLSQRMRQDVLRREQKAIGQAGKTQATSTLLSGATSAYQLRK